MGRKVVGPGRLAAGSAWLWKVPLVPLLMGSASEGDRGRLLKEAKTDAGLQPVCREGEENIRVVKASH